MKKLPIVILHGWNLSAHKFNGLSAKFRRNGYKTVCFDLPGFGRSPPPNRPYNITDYCEFVVKQLRARNIQKCILIGHSFGGRIAIKLVSQNPGSFRAVILTGAPGLNPVPRFKVKFYQTLAKAGHLIFAIPPISLLSDMARKYLYKAAQATDYYNTSPDMRETFKNVIAEDLTGYMEKIRIPSLLLWGEDDGIVPVRIAREMAKLIRNSKITLISHARHGAPWTHGDLFVTKTQDFLKYL